MTSSDKEQYLTVDLFNAKMEAMMTTIRLENEKLRSQLHEEIQNVKSELHAEIQDVRAETRINSAQIADLQHSVYWGFAILGIFITLAVFFFRDKDRAEKKSQQKYISEERIQEMIDTAISKTLSTLGK